MRTGEATHPDYPQLRQIARSDLTTDLTTGHASVAFSSTMDGYFTLHALPSHTF